MKHVAEGLRELVAESVPRLLGILEQASAVRPGPDRWSPKEILGHLVDSAANNHPRFVRAQAAPAFEGPGYDQDYWVETQGYHETRWVELVQLWRAYNLHLAHVIERVRPEALHTRCTIGDDEPCDLQFVITDYLAHQKHHLQQILGGSASGAE